LLFLPLKKVALNWERKLPRLDKGNYYMGNWRFLVEGMGCHHNSEPDIDSDLMAKEFLAKLKLAGHDISLAKFCSGGWSEEDLEVKE